MAMRESPRLRRLRSDLRAILELKAESTILDFECRGNPPEWYLLRFHGLGLWRPDGQPMSYSLDHKEGGNRLREDQTLLAAGVKDGAHLIVYPESVAG